jgi:hypothetical protein
MRKLVSIFFFGVSLIAGPANAEQNPWVPSGATAPIGSLLNGDPAVTHHLWAPGDVHTGSLPTGGPAWASRRSIRGGDIGPRHASAGQRHQGDTK